MSGAGAGLVSLVGAGPGSPDHLTLKGLRRLQQADLVLHDALVSGAVLALAESAERIDVGKRAGRASTPQHAIHSAMIAASRNGLRVVRLKGGDPFVFGRGGEEAIALAEAGVPFEIVPGVSSAIAAPALAGIPVTHRGVASAVLIINGAQIDQIVERAASIRADSMTLVVLMALRSRSAVADVLLGNGWRPATPAAIVVGASTDEWKWRGTLDRLAQVDVPSLFRDLPGTLVIGEVAAMRLESRCSVAITGGEYVSA